MPQKGLKKDDGVLGRRKKLSPITKQPLPGTEPYGITTDVFSLFIPDLACKIKKHFQFFFRFEYCRNFR